MRQSPRVAFTLMELIVSMAILSMVLMITTQSLDSSTRLNDRVTRQSDINNRANDALNKLSLQLRMADASSISMPGINNPPAFEPANPTNPKVTAFNYKIGIGLKKNEAKNPPVYEEVYEENTRRLIYDESTIPGRLILQVAQPGVGGGWQEEQLLTAEVIENGFSLARIGNTLQMALTLRSETLAGDEIIYTAQAQTIFLRSTLMESNGTVSSSSVVNDKDAQGNDTTTTDTSPSIFFGHKVTQSTASEKQISMFFTAPIGQKIEPNYIKIRLGNADDSDGAIVAEGQTVKVGTATVSRQTYPPANQWPSHNGIYSVTLTGDIPNTVTITAESANSAGVVNILSKRYQ